MSLYKRLGLMIPARCLPAVLSPEGKIKRRERERKREREGRERKREKGEEDKER